VSYSATPASLPIGPIPDYPSYRSTEGEERKCHRCDQVYRGPAIYCSFRCAQLDALSEQDRELAQGRCPRLPRARVSGRAAWRHRAELPMRRLRPALQHHHLARAIRLGAADMSDDGDGPSVRITHARIELPMPEPPVLLAFMNHVLLVWFLQMAPLGPLRVGLALLSGRMA